MSIYILLTLTTFAQMLLSNLPLDTLYVVVCHLAGMFAFGSLAALHLVNHAVAETGLPVLYETVLIDNMERPPSNMDGEDVQQKDALRRYTK
jgi:hypothetical protein